MSRPKPKPCISGNPNCGWSKTQTFVCPMCERECCYCNGCADDMPALCDDCWARVTKSPDRTCARHETPRHRDK